MMNINFGQIDTKSWTAFQDSLNQYIAKMESACSELDQAELHQIESLLAKDREMTAQLESTHNAILSRLIADSGLEFEADDDGQSMIVPTLEDIQSKTKETKDELFALKAQAEAMVVKRNGAKEQLDQLKEEYSQAQKSVAQKKLQCTSLKKSNQQRSEKIRIMMHDNNPVTMLVSKDGYLDRIISNKENVSDKEEYWQFLNQKFDIKSN